MKETGLMFKAPLVRAILSGQKTQTRRLVKDKKGTFPFGDNWDLEAIRRNYGDPYGQPGDRIYVRETFVQGYKEDRDTGMLLTCDEEGNEIPKTTWYRATDLGLTWSDDGESEVNVPWKPAIHMPKDLARIWLEVTGVRVERLQNISETDAEAEGVGFLREVPDADETLTAKQLFECLWDSTGGDWSENPWVWVIDFKRIERAAQAAQGGEA